LGLQLDGDSAGAITPPMTPEDVAHQRQQFAVSPLTRRLGMRLFSALTRLMIGQPIADTTSGFRAYGRRVMEVCQHDLPQDFPDAPLLIESPGC
jgi:hypothetical protein